MDRIDSNDVENNLGYVFLIAEVCWNKISLRIDSTEIKSSINSDNVGCIPINFRNRFVM